MKSDSDMWKTRPEREEYGSFYQKYLDKVPSGNVLTILEEQRDDVLSFIRSLTPEQALHRYREGKWTVKEVFGHMIDNERVFSYRALSIARNDPGELPGYDQKSYIASANMNERSIANLANEYESLRNSSIHMFSGFDREMIDRTGIANNYSLSVRAIPFIIAGHERHHLQVFEERYGLPVPGTS